MTQPASGKCTTGQPILHSQLMAPFAPPGFDNGAPAPSFHSSPKSVHPLAETFLGLPSSFRHFLSSLVRFTAHNYTPFSPSLQIRVAG